MKNIHIHGKLTDSDVVCNLYLSIGFLRYPRPLQLRKARWVHGNVNMDSIGWFIVEIQA